MDKQKAQKIAKKSLNYSLIGALLYCAGTFLYKGYNISADFCAAVKSKPHIDAMTKAAVDCRHNLDSIHTVYEQKLTILDDSYAIANNAIKTAQVKYDSVANVSKYNDKRIDNIRKFETGTIRRDIETEVQRRFSGARDSIRTDYQNAIAKEVAKRDSVIAAHEALISERLVKKWSR